MRTTAVRMATVVFACLAAGGLLAADEGKAPAGVGLGSFVAKGGGTSMPNVSGNASGLAYCPQSKTLFVVMNAPAKIVEFTLDGKYKRAIRLQGFADTEGIACIGSNTFAVAEEGRGDLVVFDLAERDTAVKRENARVIHVDDVGGNQGLEGVTYDPATKRFFVVKEHGPMKIYAVSADGKVSHPWDAEQNSLGLRDLSDLYFDPKSGHLLLLSHESAVAVEVTLEGKEVSRLPVKFSQAEGITMDDDGNLHICGEPNGWQVFSKKAIPESGRVKQ